MTTAGKRFFIALFLLGVLVLAHSALAQGAGDEIAKQLGAAAGSGGAQLGQPVDPRVTIILIIRVLLGFTTMVLVGFTVYAGFMWMTAGGNEEQITKAKTTIRNCVIGLVITLSSYSITILAANLARGYSTGFQNSTPLQGVTGFFLQSGK